MAARRVHLLVRGRVQGVGFRWFVREEARRLGVAGWVRNRNDGAVELMAEGEDRALIVLERAARSGPAGAVVEAVESLAPAHDERLPYPFSIERRE